MNRDIFNELLAPYRRQGGDTLGALYLYLRATYPHISPRQIPQSIHDNGRVVIEVLPSGRLHYDYVWRSFGQTPDMYVVHYTTLLAADAFPTSRQWLIWDHVHHGLTRHAGEDDHSWIDRQTARIAEVWADPSRLRIPYADPVDVTP